MFGACLVALAILVITWLPSTHMSKFLRHHSVGGGGGSRHSSHSSSSNNSNQQRGGTNTNALTPLTSAMDEDELDSDSDTVFQNSMAAAKLYRATTRESLEHRGGSSSV